MSRESLAWLNTNVLIGQTAKRGNAWHYKASEQGGEPNHYDGFIPAADVRRRLFGDPPVKCPIMITMPDGKVIESTTHAAWVDPKGNVVGVNGIDYVSHDMSTWLLDELQSIIGPDAGLGITSAGLLRGGSQGWVEISVPDTHVGPGDIAYRPNILARTSYDGSLATGYSRTTTMTVCDNTLNIAMGESEAYYARHTVNSLNDESLMTARRALGLITADVETTDAQLDLLLKWKINSRSWGSFLDAHVPTDVEDQSKASLTRMERKRDELSDLYARDERVAPWRGTAFGVLQAFNTWDHHFRIVRGASRAERNIQNTIMGHQAKNDTFYLEQLNKLVPQPA